MKIFNKKKQELGGLLQFGRPSFQLQEQFSVKEILAPHNQQPYFEEKKHLVLKKDFKK